MFIAVRVDASQQIGTGHVVRCLTLADALVAAGHEIQFISQRHAGHLAGFIEQRGHRVTLLEPTDHCDETGSLAHASWLGSSQLQDAQDSIDALQGRRPDWIITDHYALDYHWHECLRPHCQHIMVIDDLADRTHDADLLLDQNYYPDSDHRYQSLIPAACRTLTGPRFVLLREEFTRNQQRATVRSSLHHVLVFFGGVDRHNLTTTALDALQDLDLSVSVIAGNHPKVDEIAERCSELPNVDFHHSVDNMAEQILQADLAIGAGGTTTWERCYLGLPAIVVTLADNQAAVNQAVSEVGACVLAGGTETHSDTIRALLDTFITDNGRISTASQAAMQLMQGHVGVKGVIEAMEQTGG